MWPPSSEDCLLARTTIAIAFQRTIERRRRSSAGSPGSFASSSTGIVLTYGVVSEAIGPEPSTWARSTTRCRISRALPGPSWEMTASIASSHSRVSAASMSAAAPFDPRFWTRSVITCDGTHVPSADEDLVFAGPGELAERVRSREIHPRELVEACLRRIEALDPKLNAFRTTLADEGL